MTPDKRIRVISCVLAIAIAGLTLRHVYGSPLPRRWTEVRQGWLFRSAQISAGDVTAVLRDQRIDLVIDLTDDTKDPDFEAEATAARALGVRYLHAPVSEGMPADALISYARAVAAMAKAHSRGDRVLVHCEIGHRRSAAAVALYERLIEHQSPDVAYRELYRYADARATWQAGTRDMLERNLPELEARIKADLAG